MVSWEAERMEEKMATEMEYQGRVVDAELDDLMAQLPAIALEGPRGVGKTATAARRAKTAYYLDDARQREVVEADPAQVLSGEPPVLFDEWQRVPEVWDAVRRAVDRGCAPGSYLLTGSARPVTPPTHSGAGRIVKLRMRPMALSERGCGQPTVSLSKLLEGGRPSVSGRTDIILNDYVREIVASGLPGIREGTDQALQQQLDGYLQYIVDVDIQEQGYVVRRPEALKRWMTAYAAATSTSASYEKIRGAATNGAGDKPSRKATQPYRDILERLRIADPVPPWLPTRNRLKRLGWPSKHHLADPALAARALDLDEKALLGGKERGPRIHREGTLLGHLFESLVTLSVRVFAQACQARVGHFRTHGGRQEVDLIVERAGQVVAIEVKLSGVVKDADVKHLLWLREQLGDELLDAAVVNTGPHAYRRKDGIAVIPAALLGV